MKQKTKITSLLFFIELLSIFLTNEAFARSKIRKSEKQKPKIEVCREKKPKRVYFIASNYLEEDAIFKTFDKNFFYQNTLPEKITYLYDPKKSISKVELDQKLEKLVREIYKKKRKYKDFTILKNCDFNRRKKSGLMVLKFKNCPFVAKVFVENPRNFVKPYSKGFCPACIFNISGGINRHILGFTRIKNMQNIKDKLSKDNSFEKMVVMPRKWHWAPKDPKNMKITGYNFRKDNQTIQMTMPGIYCIIADAMNLTDTIKPSIFDKNARDLCMGLCNYLDLVIDPNIENFFIDKNREKVIIVDTENLRTMTKINEKLNFDSYIAWYLKIACKFLTDSFFKTKYVKR